MLHPAFAQILTLPGKIRRFEPRIRIKVDRGPYQIRTVESAKEFAAVLRLRYEIFEREFRGNRFPFGWDTDEYDLLGDHLIILERSTGRIVGNYRMISSSYSNRFYSDSEFEMESFLKLPGVKLELGRACIHQDFRNGAVMSLLWRGILAYVKEVGAQYLFGCTSVKTECPEDVSWLMAYFREKNQIIDDECIRPIPEYRMDGLDEEGARCHLNDTERLSLVPPLLASYFRAGANLAVPPAYDRYFKCVDFLTVLNTDRMAASYERRFGVAENTL